MHLSIELEYTSECILTNLLFFLCVASGQQVDTQMRRKSKRCLTENNRFSGVYDEIYDTPNTENGTEPTYPYDDIRNETTVPTQTYDEIPDNDSSSRQPYLNLNTETRGTVSLGTLERNAGAPTKPDGNGDVYCVPLVGLQNESPTSLDTQIGNNVNASDAANMATMIESPLTENQFGELDQPGYHQLDEHSRFPISTTTSGSYAVLQRNNSSERLTQLQNNKYLSLLVEVDDANASDEVTQTSSLTVDKYLSPRLEKQSSHEQDNILNDLNNAEPDDKRVYRKLNKTTWVLPTEVTRMDYASLKVCESESGEQPESDTLLSSALIGNDQTTNNVDDTNYHGLDSGTMSTSQADKSEIKYTQLQRHAQSKIFAGKYDYHGLEAATREVGTHDYAALDVNWK